MPGLQKKSLPEKLQATLEMRLLSQDTAFLVPVM